MNDLDRIMQKLDRIQDHVNKIDKKVNYTIQRVCVLEEPAPQQATERDRLIELIGCVRTVNEENRGSNYASRVAPIFLDKIEEEFSL